MKKFLCVALTVCGLTGLAGSAWAQRFPVKPVRLVVLSAGAFPDVIARRMADQLTRQWGQPVIVENRPGANGIVAAEAALQAPADGHTLIWGDPVGWHMFLQYEGRDRIDPPTASLVPLGQVVDAPMVMYVSGKLPARNLQEFIALSRASKDPLFYGTPGKFSMHHLVFELLASKTGANLRHAPFKSIPQLAIAVAAGDVTTSMISPGTIIGMLKEGRLRALAWTGSSPYEALPDVPTFAQAGVPDFVVSVKAGFYVHKATPPDLVQRLSRDLAESLRQPQVASVMTNAGAIPVGSSPQEFAQVVQRDIELLSKIARDIAAKGDN